jgi:anti-sigma-K factor RskA
VQPPPLVPFSLASKWVQVEETQVLVDDNMRRKWEVEKDEKEKIEALVATSKSALGDLSRIIDGSMVELARSAEEYARLSLSGSFSAPWRRQSGFWNSGAREWRRKELVWSC